MHGVVELKTFTVNVKKAGVTAEELDGIIDMLAKEPQAGQLIQGTGGARKVRYARHNNAGKSGGYRLITFYAAEDIPVMLLDVYGKGEKVNLTKAERNNLAAVLGQVASAYRASTKAAVERDKAAPEERRTQG